jgi:hypothetical protein
MFADHAGGQIVPLLARESENDMGAEIRFEDVEFRFVFKRGQRRGVSPPFRVSCVASAFWYASWRSIPRPLVVVVAAGQVVQSVARVGEFGDCPAEAGFDECRKRVCEAASESPRGLRGEAGGLSRIVGSWLA